MSDVEQEFPRAANPRRKGAKAPLISLDQPGRLRVCNMLALLNVSHSKFYAGLASGTYPSADGHDGRPYWNTSTIRRFLLGAQ